MKRILLLSFTACLAQAAMSQPVLNKLFDYSPGDEYIFRKIVTGTTIDSSTIVTVGANLTWDLSGLQFESTSQKNEVIDLASSMYPAKFAGCTYVFKEYNGLEQFFTKVIDTVKYMGNSYGGGALFSPAPPAIILPTSYSASGQVFDNFQTNVPGLGTWTYRARYNAYGTLKLPGNINIPNVGLYIGHGGDAALSYTDYMWAKENEKDPLLRIQFKHQGGSTSVQYAYVTIQALSVNEVNGTRILSSITPNPASDQITITSAKGAKCIIYDMSGKAISAHEANRNIDISRLSNGIYMIMVAGEDGSKETLKFVKQ